MTKLSFKEIMDKAFAEGYGKLVHEVLEEAKARKEAKKYARPNTYARVTKRFQWN